MKVYVVMGNDFPEAVFEKEEDADDFCVKQKWERGKGFTRIYWRVYEFTLQEGK